jgi:exonuclease III
VLIVSWNRAGRVKRLKDQAKLVLALEADVLCLQEVTPHHTGAVVRTASDARP